MKKRIIISAFLTASLILCTGCGNKSVTTVTDNPSSDSETLTLITEEAAGEQAPKLNLGNGHTNDSLDLGTISANAVNSMLSKGYDLEGVSIDPPDEKNNFFNIIIVANTTQDDETYIKLCNETIAYLNEEAIKQDPEYSPAKEGYYGGLFDQYDILLTATSSEDVLEMWAVYQTIESQTHVPVKITNTKFDLGNMN